MHQPPKSNRPGDDADKPITAAQMNRLNLEQTASSGASWFYWIGALSLVNSIMTYTNSSFGFPIGLGVTQIVDAVASQSHNTTITIFAASFDAIAAGAMCAFGYFSKTIPWLFIPGMVLYAIDGLALGAFGAMTKSPDWIGVGFHAFALYCLFRGYQCSKDLAKIRKLEALERSARHLD